MMKKTILLCLLLSAGALLRGQNVKVNVSGTAADKTRMVYLYDDMRMEKVIDSIATRNGKWSFNQERPLNSLLLASTARPQTDSSQENTVVFFADEATTTVDLDACQVEGSRQSTEANRAFQGLVTCARSSMLPQNGDVDWKMKALSIMRTAVMDNLDNMVPVVFTQLIADALSVGELSRVLSPSAPYFGHPYMDGPKKTLERMKENVKKRPLGARFTDLTMNDADGKPHRLSEWCGKGNYVLVDFWASWCGPCLREMPNVVANYKKYHEKGFNVVGISFDKQKEPWLAAVKKLGMEWPQLSDLKGWESIAGQTYGIRSIPANMLLDEYGRIVDVDLRDEALGETLKRIYGE